MNTAGGNMKLVLEQYETRYVELINKMYDYAISHCSSLQHLKFILDTSPLGYNVEVSKGFEEDEGTYKISIRLSDDIEKVKESFAMGMAMIVYDSVHGETNFNELDDTGKNEFIHIYTDILYKEGE